MQLSGGTVISCNGGALRDSRSAGPMCVGSYPLLCGGMYCVGVAAECARVHLMALGSVSTKRFMFIIMAKRRDYARSASASINDLNKR